MQVRRGQTKQTNMPQLSSGEFGWSIDTQQLFIGNGAITEGAPAVGNTEVITEHNINNFFLYAEAGYKYFSTLTDVRSVFRPIQEKLDDFVSLNDFITTSTDYSVAIQNAVTHASSRGKPLYMPEGDYSVTATIFIPPKTEIRGAGLGKTVILAAPSSTSTIFQTVSSTGKLFESGDMHTDPSKPELIKISGVSFISPESASQSIINLDYVTDSVIENCGFRGNDAVSTATSTLTTAISFRGNSIVPNNVAIKNCVFDYLGTAVYSDYDISNITITENKFYTLDTGVVFGKKIRSTTGALTGAKHVRISNNAFNKINRQAVYVGTTSTAKLADVSDIVSFNNDYINVGNLGNGEIVTNNVVEVIRFESWGNVSKNDNFDRLNVNNSESDSDQFKANITDPLNVSRARVKPLVHGPAIIEASTPKYYNIKSVNGADYPFFVYPLSSYTYGSNTKSNIIITIDYTLTKPNSNLIRRGTLEIVVNGNNRSDTVIKDTFSSNITASDGDIEFALVPEDQTPDYINENSAIVVLVRNKKPPVATLTYTFTVRQ